MVGSNWFVIDKVFDIGIFGFIVWVFVSFWVYVKDIFVIEDVFFFVFYSL